MPSVSLQAFSAPLSTKIEPASAEWSESIVIEGLPIERQPNSSGVYHHPGKFQDKDFVNYNWFWSHSIIQCVVEQMSVIMGSFLKPTNAKTTIVEKNRLWLDFYNQQAI
jgi:hypothetical protein